MTGKDKTEKPGIDLEFTEKTDATTGESTINVTGEVDGFIAGAKAEYGQSYNPDGTHGSQIKIKVDGGLLSGEVGHNETYTPLTGESPSGSTAEIGVGKKVDLDDFKIGAEAKVKANLSETATPTSDGGKLINEEYGFELEAVLSVGNDALVEIPVTLISTNEENRGQARVYPSSARPMRVQPQHGALRLLASRQVAPLSYFGAGVVMVSRRLLSGLRKPGWFVLHWLLVLSLPVHAVADQLPIYQLPEIKNSRLTESGKNVLYIAFTSQPTSEQGKRLLKLIPLERDQQAIENDEERIRQLATEATKANDPVGLTINGIIARYGWHSPQSHKAAYVHFQKAAVQGEGFAEYQIGLMVQSGEISPKDDAVYEIKTKKVETLKPEWRFEKPLEDKPIQATLPTGEAIDLRRGAELARQAERFTSGTVTQANLKRAWIHYNRAMKMRHPAATTRIGLIIHSGEMAPIGIEANNHKAIPMIRQAAETGWPEAQSQAVFLLTWIGGFNDPETVKDWGEKLLAKGDPDFDQAYVALAASYLREKRGADSKRVIDNAWAITNKKSASVAAGHAIAEGLVFKNPTHARALEKWGQLAASLQDPKLVEFYPGRLFAAISLMWLDGRLGKDRETAEKWIELGIREKSSFAHLRKALVCAGHYGGATDSHCEISNLTTASNLGNPRAKTNLGLVLIRGLGVEKQPDAGTALLTEAAILGDPYAMRLLAKAFALGVGTQQSYPQCVFWNHIADTMNAPLNQDDLDLAKSCLNNISAQDHEHQKLKAERFAASLPALNR